MEYLHDANDLPHAVFDQVVKYISHELHEDAIVNLLFGAGDEHFERIGGFFLVDVHGNDLLSDLGMVVVEFGILGHASKNSGENLVACNCVSNGLEERKNQRAA